MLLLNMYSSTRLSVDSDAGRKLEKAAPQPQIDALVRLMHAYCDVKSTSAINVLYELYFLFLLRLTD
jgi:hypothetical protein